MTVKYEVTLPFPKTIFIVHQNVYVVNANTILHRGPIFWIILNYIFFSLHMIPKLRLPFEIIFTLVTGIHALISYDSNEGYNILNFIDIDDSQIWGD